MDKLKSTPGNRLVQRLEGRISRRPRLGLTPKFFTRLGLSDPWLGAAARRARRVLLIGGALSSLAWAVLCVANLSNALHPVSGLLGWLRL